MRRDWIGKSRKRGFVSVFFGKKVCVCVCVCYGENKEVGVCVFIECIEIGRSFQPTSPVSSDICVLYLHMIYSVYNSEISNLKFYNL